MTKKFEIYFKDLQPEAQANLLEIFEKIEKDENWGVFPVTVIETEVS